jgi:hypothetical protein
MKTKTNRLPYYWIEFRDRWNKNQRLHPEIFRSQWTSAAASLRDKKPNEDAFVYRWNGHAVYQLSQRSLLVWGKVKNVETKNQLEKTLSQITGISLEELHS